MADTSELKISRELFRWARESAGLPLELAAKRIGIQPARLEEWEGVGALPTPRQLEKAADAYKRTVATFFLPSPPSEPPLPVDFRTTSDVTSGLSTEARFAVRRARWLKGIFAELNDGERATSGAIPEARQNQAESIAVVIREWFASTLRAVKGKRPSDALRFWREAMEDAGLLVFQFPMPRDEVHAFSLSDGVPSIVLNSHDAHSRRIFSAVHELAHLILRQPGLCNPSEVFLTRGSPEVEVTCNAAAGLALVPDASLVNHELTKRLTRGGDVIELLSPIARDFAVSRQVVIMRLLQLDIVNRTTFQRTMDILQAEYVELQKKKKPKIIVPPSTKAVGQLGKKFVSSAFAAYERGAITDADLSEYLGVRLQHLDRIQMLAGVE